MCRSCTVDIDRERRNAAAEKLLGILNNAGTALMISLGHRTGLFDVMSETPPATSEELASHANLNERYVREWLGAMTTAGLVELDPASNRYALPPEFAAHLTREAGADNIAGPMQWISVLASVEDEVLRAFHDGKGVPYAAYRRFHEVMAEDSAGTVLAGLENHILPLEPGLIETLERGIDVLDVGCGAGRAMIHLAERFPNSRFVGYDFEPDAIDAARTEARRREIGNIRFEVQDVTSMPDTSAFDVVFTFDAVHDQAHPDLVLANIHRALKPGGLYLMQDIQGTSSHHGDKNHPMAPFIYAISCMHCMSVSLASGGMGLGAAWGRRVALQMLADAGFRDVRVETLSHDIQNFYYLTRKSA